MAQQNYITNAFGAYYRHEINEDLQPDAYSMHTHNMYELLYIVSGDATHVVEDRKYKLKPGDLILIRPLHYHYIQIDSPTTYERYNILFDIEGNNVQSASLIPEDIEVINLAGNEVIGEIFKKCDLYYTHSDSETFEKILCHLLSELFYYLVLFPQAQQAKNLGNSRMLSKALNYINKHLCKPFTVADVAEHLFVSESYLFRLFQKELHQTPRKYIMDKRLIIAKKMIDAGEKPTLVSEKCGFGDYTTFYRNYVSFFGSTPSKAE